MPGGPPICQPPMIESSQDGQILKNQKKSQGTTNPPSVGLGDSTGVVTGIMNAPTVSEEVDAVSEEAEVSSACEVTPSGLIVVTRPLGNVVVTGAVMPVGMVIAPSSPFEMTVWPAEFVTV